MAEQEAMANQEEELVTNVNVSQVDLSAISYSADPAGDYQDESALFRQLESSTASAAILEYSEDIVNEDADETRVHARIDKGEEIIVEIEDGAALGVVVAPLEASLSVRSGCNGLRVLICKVPSSPFRAQDIIVEVNGLSLTKMTCENALAVIKKATNRKFKVLRKRESTEAQANNEESEIGGHNVVDENWNENEHDNGESIVSKWGQLKRRCARRIDLRNSRRKIYIAGEEVKVDRERLCAPTMEPYIDYVPGGRRCENKKVFTDILADMSRRSRKRSLSPN